MCVCVFSLDSAGVLPDVGGIQRRRPPLGDESHGRHRKAMGHSQARGWSGQNVCGRTDAPGELTPLVLVINDTFFGSNYLEFE